MVVSKKLMKVGPWGGGGGHQWDDGGHSGIRSITVSYDRFINSISVEYDRDGVAVPGERHGGAGGNQTTQARSTYHTKPSVGSVDRAHTVTCGVCWLGAAARADQAGLPGRAPDGRERALLPDRGRRVAGDPVAGVPEQPAGVRAVRGGGGRGVHVPGGRGRHRRLLREERLAARRRRALRRAAAPGEDVRQGAEVRGLGVPCSDATDRAAAAAARAGETVERQSSEISDNPQDVVAIVTLPGCEPGCFSACSIQAGV